MDGIAGPRGLHLLFSSCEAQCGIGVRMSFNDARRCPPTGYDLADRYRHGSGPVLLTGVQAIARLLVEQRTRDRIAGLNTAAFVTGYQGSPLGGVDRMLLGMPKVLAEHAITFVPGFNEELAATAAWGSQHIPDGAKFDGVVGVWYGKGPGLDRAMDVLRHANTYGADPRGGMLLIVGDDPAAKSSTVPAVSERTLAAIGVPVFYPRNAREIVIHGLHAIALSRASGCLVALKIVADVADGAWTVSDEDLRDVEIAVPEIDVNGARYEYRKRPMDVAPQKIMEAESELVGPRRRLIDAYVDMNLLAHVEGSRDRADLGIVAGGTTYDAVRQALVDLGLDDQALRSSGVRLLRLGMMWPISPSTVKSFAEGLETLLVVEDKSPFVETQIREILYGDKCAPIVVGKLDATGSELIPAGGELTAGRLVRPLRRQLGDRVGLRRPLPPPLPLEPLPVKRAAYFCSGCPHNRSTGLPDGSIGAGGIGCHILVTMSGRTDSAVTGLTQMGGEGAQWIGQAPFTEVGHTFQNLGDGTYFHSGQLAIQACVAAGVNITYKLLYNEVVAMTGAQEAAGMLTVPDLTHKLRREGVGRIIVCADQPPRYRQRDLAEGTLLWDRDRIDDAQRQLRDTPGVSVLIYDQHCAADARRKRKRGELPPRSTRVVINESVCEGCGDCGVKSNCLSVQPVETEFGTKTRIDQTSCNTDYSCLDGDCPAFVTVQLPEEDLRYEAAQSPVPPDVPDPVNPRSIETRNVFLAGIGGTGIVTVNQVLATAALRAGFEVAGLDQIGLSQKAGPVVSHLRFSEASLEPANRLSPGSADCILAFDLLAAADIKNLEYGARERTVVVASTSRTATGDMVYDRSIAYPEDEYLLDRLRTVSTALTTMDALAAAETIFGDTTAANFLVVGAAFQSGCLGLPASAIEEAIAINGVAIQRNIEAFRWGRVAVAEPDVFHAVAAPKPKRRPSEAAKALLDHTTLSGETLRRTEIRASELTSYQSERLARRYVELVQHVWGAERAVTDETVFSEAVSTGLHKFMAYKDEYEVARLLTDPEFAAEVQAQLPGAQQLTYTLHPPMLRALGLKRKITLTPRVHWVLRVVAKGRVLRGTRLDPFGYARLRRIERQLLAHYTDLVTTLANGLTAENYVTAVRIALLPNIVRGYEDIKLVNIAKYCEQLTEHGIEPPDVWSRR